MLGPIVIGASGGSGTRLVQGIVAHCGVHMGHSLNASKDTLPMAAFLDANVGSLLLYARGLNYSLSDIPSTQRHATLASLSVILENLESTKPAGSQLRGFKNPRSIFVLPFLKALLPDFRFVHVVRDGRDMAMSQNKNQSRQYFRTLFPGASLSPDSAEAAICMWAKVNTEAAEWCGRFLPGSYVRVHYEALCANPAEQIAALLSALNLSTRDSELLAELVKPSPGIGRWSRLSSTAREALYSYAGRSLELFGYT